MKNHNKLSLRRIISNIFWIISFVIKKGKILILESVLKIVTAVITAYFSVNITGWIFKYVENGKKISEIVGIVVFVYLFLIILNFLFAVFNITVNPLKKIDVTTEMRMQLFKKIKKVNYLYFQDPNFYNQYSLGIKEVDKRVFNVLDSLCMIVSGSLCFLVVTGVAGSINSGFTIWGLIAGIYPIFISVFEQKLHFKLNTDLAPEQRRHGYVERVAKQPEFSGDLKIYSKFTEVLFSRYKLTNVSMKNILFQFGKKKLLLNQLWQIPEIILRKVAPWITIIILLVNNKITVAEATVLSSAALTIPNSINNILEGFAGSYQHGMYIDNLRKIFEIPEDIEIEREDLKLLDEINSISFNNVSFSYAKDMPIVMDKISLSFEKGRKYALVGYNGAGKTTLSKMIIRLFDPISGQITINGVDQKQYYAKSLRDKIAYISQDFRIYGFSVGENVLMRPIECEEDRALVKKSLISVGLWDKIEASNRGIDCCVTREFEADGIYFSGGEAQKLAIARVLAGDYDTIIMDEATSALDPISEDEILSLIFHLFKDKTVIMISHRLVCINYVDEIFFLSQGKLMEHGTQTELLNAGGEYSTFYLAQAKKYNGV